jgi:hypothetical protein
MALPHGAYIAMLEQIERIRARENMDLLLIRNTKDPKWLYERWKALSEYGACGAPVSDEEAEGEWNRLRELLGQ